MKIVGMIWLDEIEDKIETKHGVAREEVEEVFFIGKPKIKKMRKGHFRNEHVYRALGQTEDGRYVAVFFIYKTNQKALVLSARDMDDKERQSYGQK